MLAGPDSAAFGDDTTSSKEVQWWYLPGCAASPQHPAGFGRCVSATVHDGLVGLWP